MGNVLLGFPNRIDEAALAGGSWNAALPLTKLQNRVYAAVARSANALTTSTQWTVTLPTARVSKLVVLAAHNLSELAQWRVTAYSDAFTTVALQSPWTDVWENVPTSLLEWENDNFWTIKPSAEDIARYTPLAILTLSAAVSTRWLKIEIADTANSAGYVQVGRCLICDQWQPTVNMNYGHALQYESDTTVERALDGTEYFNRQRGRRVARFALAWLNEDEAIARVLGMQRDSGIDGEIVFIDDPDAVMYRLERRFIGRLRQLSAIEHPYFETYQNSFELSEIL
ncbi:hypothetical protein [Candidatus Contendibacter odensensis]|uniref:Uncharacterized protein n=1 Tax=Candidatus Contendobacter odensis Run_B_J11 TaxID=1400861 RepID=A0A7U7G8V5_9GAMM|nr:hypothetical protein [Candidatus Contendobacter odensis]CDH43862.1 conserved hypothetical protein [Candidatus Contendobacter odensis Run_B_J11]